ncbi:3-ketoacyl-ACP reductase [Bradyrhizobium canariense]|uniref:NAD(P)-dependent dehydrogenase, short-chain alcohol dehydrogenase family n=1 Tax=Bradyrhizobium canariense TaxID=255045 RepID=A0A1H1SHP1_9BRAD|nr:3-ketoacyl-ACP reductase [Bradyrhizobium canariense]SDS47534.1 NAD(P)-dependent dehydrogenase, short-chain alcohol dehydrogenase family [Bradyrhizobium canariense]
MAGVSSKRGTAIVTGGARGIGEATAVALAKSGFDIAVVDTAVNDTGERTIAAIRETGSRADFIRGDIADLGRHAALIDRAAALGPIACLVNNAGINVPVRGDMLETTPEVFDLLIGVNLRGTFFLTQAVAQHMLANPAGELKRSIVIISSANATMASPEKAVYCISKTGLAMMAKLYAARLADSGIDVFEVQPGLIRTKMNEAVRESYGHVIKAGASLIRRWGEPEEVGQVVSALATGLLPFCTGTMVPVGGGLHVHRL